MSFTEDEPLNELKASPPFSNSYEPPVIPGISTANLDGIEYPPAEWKASSLQDNDGSDEDDPSAAFLTQAQMERENEDVPLSIRFQRGIPRAPRYMGIVKEFALHTPKINSHVIIKDNGIISGWKDIRDLDSFLASLYNYYTGKGYFCILSNQLTTLL